MLEQISIIKTSKGSPLNTIPAKLIKENCHLLAPILLNNFNNNIVSHTFPDKLKLADVIPSQKKDDRTLKTNYRPVSLFSTISKIYERLLFSQLNNYFDIKLSPHQCGYRKGYSAQHSLVVMIEKWKKSKDYKEFAGALFTDLSKAFDTIAHDFLLVKLNAYGVEIFSLNIIASYLSNRYQRVKINSS